MLTNFRPVVQQKKNCHRPEDKNGQPIIQLAPSHFSFSIALRSSVRASKSQRINYNTTSGNVGQALHGGKEIKTARGSRENASLPLHFVHPVLLSRGWVLNFCCWVTAEDRKNSNGCEREKGME